MIRGVGCITFDIFFKMYSIWRRISDKFTEEYVILVSARDRTWETYNVDDNSWEIYVNLLLSIWWTGSIDLFLSGLYLLMFRYFCHLNTLYMFICFNAHIAKRAYILLLIYTYKCLHISTAIYALCISTYFHANKLTHVYMLLRPYTFTSLFLHTIHLHTSTPTLLYLITYFTSIFALYIFTYFYALIRPIHV
jgi:hypothetical protein